MDLSYWNSNYPGAKISNSTKQYFQKYLWKLEIYAEGGRLISSKTRDLQAALEERRARNAYPRFSWYSIAPLNNVNVSTLEIVRNIKETSDKVRVRIEEPNIQFYAADEATLKDIATKFSDKSCIVEVTGPENDDVAAVLQDGAIITKTLKDYTHKVILKDGRYSTKPQILNYLDSLGENVRLSTGCRIMLSKQYESMWNVFFYTNDPHVSVFLNLIEPGIISNMHKLVVAPNK
jgi:hypothetical protein